MDLSKSDDAPSYAPTLVRLSRCESGHYQTKLALFLRCFGLFGRRLWTFLEVGVGAAKRIRTPDPRITNALLYQLSYCGVFEAGGILTRSITRRKTGISPCNIAQGLGQGKYHVLLAAVQFGGHFPAPLPQLGYHALHQNLRRRGSSRHADRFDPLEPFAP